MITIKETIFENGTLTDIIRLPRRKEAPDWFGCGRVITQESWDRFLAAQRAYWKQKDAEAGVVNRKEQL